MREIEFRGKRLDNGEWVYGSLVHITETYKGEEDTQNCDIYQIVTYDGVAFCVNPETIGQYTGLRDKNGKKIFEGDIVETNRDVIAKVLWDNDYLGYFLYVNEQNSIEDFENGEQPLYDYFGDIEVIGNATDNPELLEVEDE